VRKRQSDIVAVVSQGLGSVQSVKAFGREALEAERMSVASRATVDAALRARRIKALLSPVVTVVVALCTAFVLWRGTSLIVAGAMTAGALTVFLAYLSKFFKPVQDLAKMTNTIAQTAIGLERIQTILATDEMIHERPDAVAPGKLRGAVAFEHVAFSYGLPQDGNAGVLRDIDFSVRAGEVIGVVGPTGSGKSTVVSLIPRFYDTTGGRVTLDGRDVRDYKLHALRDQISFVLQDTLLFRATIWENISYGSPDASIEDTVRAAELANAHEFIVNMPEGYATMVGERGATLSGGQRQRIAIARAIVRNAPILILDEPTAGLDAASEQAVIEGLDRLMKGRTTVVIAHHLGTIRHADVIFVVKDAEVVEQGTHEALLAKGGLYAELYRIQTSDGAATT